MSSRSSWQHASGKVILFGEHSVVYGRPAIAGAINQGVKAIARKSVSHSSVAVKSWGLDLRLSNSRQKTLIEKMFAYLQAEMKLNVNFSLVAESTIPPASGLGASAGLAVASIRALDKLAGQNLGNERINELAYGCECLAHGTPSGLDNTLATYGGLLSYCKQPEKGATFNAIKNPVSIPLVIALSGKKGFTAETVKRVREARDRDPAYYERCFDDIGALVVQAQAAIESGDFSAMAELMSLNQVKLREIGVSCDELERVIDVALDAGALGGKLTGSGDGGAAVFYAGDLVEEVCGALDANGFKPMRVTLN